MNMWNLEKLYKKESCTKVQLLRWQMDWEKIKEQIPTVIEKVRGLCIY